MPNDPVDFISTAEAADLLGVSVWTVLRRAARGELDPAARMPGSRGGRLWHRSDVIALRDEATKAAS